MAGRGRAAAGPVARLAAEEDQPALGRRLVEQLHDLEERRVASAREAKAFHFRPEPATAALAARAVGHLRQKAS